jgi:hypothetical protein
VACYFCGPWTSQQYEVWPFAIKKGWKLLLQAMFRFEFQINYRLYKFIFAISCNSQANHKTVIKRPSNFWHAHHSWLSSHLIRYYIKCNAEIELLISETKNKQMRIFSFLTKQLMSQTFVASKSNYFVYYDCVGWNLLTVRRGRGRYEQHITRVYYLFIYLLTYLVTDELTKTVADCTLQRRNFM